MKYWKSIFGVVVVLIAWWLWPRDHTSLLPRQDTVPVEASTDPALEPYEAEINEIKEMEKTHPEEAKKKGEALLARLPEKYQRYYQMGFKAGMLPIHFYGQIVDQYGAPVANPVITFETGGSLLAPGKGIGRVNADEQGRFEIHSEGGSLMLYGVSAPNIEFQYPVPHYGGTHSVRRTDMTFYGYQRQQGGNAPLWTDTSPEKPYVFTAWRVEKYEDVKVSNINGYYLSDERTYTINLEGKNIHEKIVEGISDGHLRVSCFHPLMQNSRDSVNWKVVISPIDGGIQATDDIYLNLAPESGYQPSLTIDMQPSMPGYAGALVNQRYFFTANNGQVYGSLYVHMTAYGSENECRINIAQYKVNLDGSRNLTVKPRH